MFERYLELLNEKGIKNIDVSRATDIPASTFSDWKKGKSSPKREKIEKIADYFGVNPDWLAGTSEFKTTAELLQHYDDVTDLPTLRSEIKTAKIGTIQIPVLGEVAAGVPISAEENWIDCECISEHLAATGDFFGLKIKGDSMSPRISDGDTVIVRQQEDADSGDVVIVLINGDSATCKRLMKYAEGISLISFNPAYEPKSFTNKEIMELPVKIIGKVVENRQKY
jgi:repressor LexA